MKLLLPLLIGLLEKAEPEILAEAKLLVDELVKYFASKIS